MSNANCFIAGVNYEDPELKNAPPLPNPDAEELARKEADKRRFRLDVVRARLQRIFESKRKDEFCCSLENTWLKLEEMMAGPALAELYDAEPEKFAKLESAIEANEMNLVDCPTDDQVQNLRKKVSEAQRKGVLKKLYAGDQVQADSLAHQPFVFWKNMGRETFHEWVTRISQILKQNNGPPVPPLSSNSDDNPKPPEKRSPRVIDSEITSNVSLQKQVTELQKKLAEQDEDLRQKLEAAEKAKAEPGKTPPPADPPASPLPPVPPSPPALTSQQIEEIVGKALAKKPPQPDEDRIKKLVQEALNAKEEDTKKNPQGLSKTLCWLLGGMAASIIVVFVLALVAIFLGWRASGNGGAAANKPVASQTQSDDSEVLRPKSVDFDLSELE